MQLEAFYDFLITSPNKALKTLQTIDSNEVTTCPSPRIMNPLPLVRKDLPNDSKMRAKLIVRGDKYFSKVVASGSETCLTLEKIKKSPIKVILNFEFDPYLCKSSGLKSLYRMSKKLSMTNMLTLYIRRIDKKTDLNCIFGTYNQILRLEKFKIEYPCTTNLYDADLRYLYSKFKKGCPVKFIEANTLSLPQMTEKGAQALFNYIGKLYLLKEAILSTLKQKTILYDTSTIPTLNFPKLPRLKRFSTSLGRSPTNWAPMLEWIEECLVRYVKAITIEANLSELSIKFTRYPITSNVVLALVDTLARLKQLRHFSIEFIKTQIEDLDILLLSKGASQFPHIEQLTIKVIQHPNLSEQCIYEFVDDFSKCDNLKKFDFYFRRLMSSPSGVERLGNKLLYLKNLETFTFKQSLHVYRRSDTEDNY